MRDKRPDVCLVQVPYLFSWGMVAGAVATLSGFLSHNGVCVEVVDLHGEWNRLHHADEAEINASIAATCRIDYPSFLDRMGQERKDFFIQAADHIAAIEAPLVALSVTFRTAWLPAVYLAERLKERGVPLVVVGGGAFDPSVTTLVAKATPPHTVDLYAIGEGELPLCDLAKQVAQATRLDAAFLDRMVETIAGLGRPYFGEGMVMSSPITESVSSLDDLPFADYTGYDLANVDTLTHSIARSCNAKCSFCSSRRTGDSYKMMSGRRTADELIYLAERHGVRRFYFSAPLVNGDMRKFRDLCGALVEREADLRLRGLFRHTKKMTEEDVDLAVRAGFEWMKFGLESGSPNVRRDMRKLPDHEHSLRIMKAVADRGARVATNVMHSFPTETEADFQETLQFINNFTPDELEWAGWPFNLGFVGNGELDRDFVDRFGIRVLRNHGLSNAHAGFTLRLEWVSDLITPSIRADRQKRLNHFREAWLARSAGKIIGPLVPEVTG